MNVLFVTPSAVIPQNGGIERITRSVSDALTDLYGYKCYFLNLTEDCSQTHIAQLLNERKINVVIAQGADKRIANLLPIFRQAIQQIPHHVALLFVYHINPGFELTQVDYAVLWNRIVHGSNLKTNCIQLGRQLLSPFVWRSMRHHLKHKYRLPYDVADKIVLLSPHFIPEYMNFSEGEEDKFTAIPNMLSFLPEQCDYEEKKPIVLLVSRMDERQKRIKLALKIWKRIPNNGWELKIVGVGEDWEYYKRLAKKWQLKNISFDGLQNPLPYYKSASIFLMTSAAEGWGLTLTEAQQCGCVPIAFDSYSAVHDIILSGRNGYIVPNNDIDEYVRVLQELMNNDTLRAEMAANAQKDVQRFSRENIAKQWKTLLENL